MKKIEKPSILDEKARNLKKVSIQDGNLYIQCDGLCKYPDNEFACESTEDHYRIDYNSIMQIKAMLESKEKLVKLNIHREYPYNDRGDNLIAETHYYECSEEAPETVQLLTAHINELYKRNLWDRIFNKTIRMI